MKLLRFEKQEIEYQKSQIKLFMTSLKYNSKYTTDTDRVEHLIKHHNIQFTIIDVVFNKEEWNKLNLKDKNFPLVIAYGRVLGGYEDLQELHDSGFLSDILHASKFFIPYLNFLEFLKKCLSCHCTRESTEKSVCAYCWKKYEFFAK